MFDSLQLTPRVCVSSFATAAWLHERNHEPREATLVSDHFASTMVRM